MFESFRLRALAPAGRSPLPWVSPAPGPDGRSPHDEHATRRRARRPCSSMDPALCQRTPARADGTVRFAGIFIGTVNACFIGILSVGQHAAPRLVADTATCQRLIGRSQAAGQTRRRRPQAEQSGAVACGLCDHVVAPLLVPGCQDARGPQLHPVAVLGGAVGRVGLGVQYQEPVLVYQLV
jgi:hypothetical protein